MEFTGFDKKLAEALKGRYELLGLLGKGGMSRVYKALQLSVDREVALKIIHPSLATEEETVARFKQEAKSAAKLSHDNIITVYDVGESEGLVYICLELLDGEELTTFLKEKGRLRTDQVVSIIAPIASALGEIHEKDLIHRDIKSSNIFISKKGKPVLLDFGIATFRESSTGVTLPGMVIGTPEYMSPEQANGQKIGPESDIYSLGVVMFQCLSGEVPFLGESPVSTIVKISQGLRPELDKESLEIPQWLYDVVMKCLAHNPEERFHSASDLHQSLMQRKLVESVKEPKIVVAKLKEEETNLVSDFDASTNLEDRVLAMGKASKELSDYLGLESEITLSKSVLQQSKNIVQHFTKADESIANAEEHLIKGEFSLASDLLKKLAGVVMSPKTLRQKELYLQLAQDALKMEHNIRLIIQPGNAKGNRSQIIIGTMLTLGSTLIVYENLKQLLGEPNPELKKRILEVEDVFYGSVKTYITSDEIDLDERKQTLLLLLELLRLEAYELAIYDSFRGLLNDLNSQVIYKENSFFKDFGSKQSEEEIKEPTPIDSVSSSVADKKSTHEENDETPVVSKLDAKAENGSEPIPEITNSAAEPIRSDDSNQVDNAIPPTSSEESEPEVPLNEEEPKSLSMEDVPEPISEDKALEERKTPKVDFELADHFNQFVNEKVLPSSVFSEFLATDPEEAKTKTLNRLFYMFFTPKRKGNGLEAISAMALEWLKGLAVGIDKEKEVKFLLDGEALPTSGQESGLDLKTKEGIAAWDAALKERLKNLRLDQKMETSSDARELLEIGTFKVLIMLREFLISTYLPKGN